MSFEKGNWCRPFRYELWCFGSICHKFLIFLRLAMAMMWQTSWIEKPFWSELIALKAIYVTQEKSWSKINGKFARIIKRKIMPKLMFYLMEKIEANYFFLPELFVFIGKIRIYLKLKNCEIVQLFSEVNLVFFRKFL